MNELEQLYSLLCEHLSPNRKGIIERVSAERTQFFGMGIEDLYYDRNSGAVARTADALGFQHLHVIERKYNSKISTEISKGAEKWITIHKYDQPKKDNSKQCIDSLQTKGFHIVATSPHQNTVSLPHFEPTQPCVFFFGGEGQGLTEQVLDRADTHLQIPSYGFSESYNISVAAALVMQSIRDRFRNTKHWLLDPIELLVLRIVWVLKSVRNNKFALMHAYAEKCGLTKDQVNELLTANKLTIEGREIKF